MSRLERTVGPVAAVLGGVALVGAAFLAATAATAVVFARRVVIPEPQREDAVALIGEAQGHRRNDTGLASTRLRRGYEQRLHRSASCSAAL